MLCYSSSCGRFSSTLVPCCIRERREKSLEGRIGNLRKNSPTFRMQSSKISHKRKTRSRGRNLTTRRRFGSTSMARSLERLFKRGLATLLRLLFHSSPPRDLPRFFPESILVIRQHNQLGDMLCVVPLLRGLRAKYPSARITLMASPVNYEIMLNNRWLDEVILYDKRELLKNGRIRFKSLLKLIKGIRGRFGLVLVPGTVSTSFTSDLLAFLTGAHVRIGVAGLNGEPNKSTCRRPRR